LKYAWGKFYAWGKPWYKNHNSKADGVLEKKRKYKATM
jgi:hypothetical protein